MHSVSIREVETASGDSSIKAKILAVGQPSATEEDLLVVESLIDDSVDERADSFFPPRARRIVRRMLFFVVATISIVVFSFMILSARL